MPNLITTGRVIYAVALLGLAFICVLSQDFIIGRPPAWPASVAGIAPLLGYALGAVIMLAMLAILFHHRYAGYGALVVAGLILFFSVFRHLAGMMADWLNTYKALALLGGSLVVASSYAREVPVKKTGGEKTINVVIYVGCIFLTLFFVAGGYSHFIYVDFIVNGFIPAYIPFQTFFAYFCGVCLIAGGIGLLIPATRYWAALMSGIMVLGWFLLLHIPRTLANINDASDRMGLCESFAFVGMFFVAAGMFKKKTLSQP